MCLSVRAGILCAVLLTALPSVAAAKTLVVEPTGAGGAYRTIGSAVAAASAGDTVAIAKGDYVEDVKVPLALTGLQIVGVDGARLYGGSQGPALDIEAGGVRVTTLAVGPTPLTGVRVEPSGSAVLTGVTVTRETGTPTDQPLVDVRGTAQIAKGFVQQTTGLTTTPAIASSGSDGVQIADTTIINQVGPAVVVRSSARNAIARSTLVSTLASADALQLRAESAGSRALVVDSSILVGGTSGAGVRVATQGAPASDVSSLVLRHDTLFGAGRGLALDATAPTTVGLPSGPAGSIAATVVYSIVHESSTAKGNPGSLIAPRNGVGLAFVGTDTPPVASADRNDSAAVTTTAGTYTPDIGRLFGNGVHLRADAPLIDRGSSEPLAGESATDIDGQPRRIGAATDIGADEYLNVAPQVALSASSTRPIEDRPVTFTSTATDPNVGDGVTEYFWDFGDGTRTSTTVSTTSHSFKRTGPHTVSLSATDHGGLSSEIASVPVTVRDGHPPVVTTTVPTGGRTMHLNPPGRNSRRLVAYGTDTDATGVARVEVSLSQRRTATSCRHYTGRSFVAGRCTARRWLKAKLLDTSWTLATRRGLRVRPGRYELRVRAVDIDNMRSSAGGQLIRFTVR